jgi:hypothetical protein
VCDVVVAWALLRVFSPVSRDLSRLAAWFRLAYSAVFLVSLAQLIGHPAGTFLDRGSPGLGVGEVNVEHAQRSEHERR